MLKLKLKLSLKVIAAVLLRCLPSALFFIFTFK
jgi:hypothetical protein